MNPSKPPVRKLHEMQPGETADCYAMLAERTKGATRDGKPYFTCRFRDAKRSATLMVWADSDWFQACRDEWREGQCFKLRATYGDHERYGPQLDLKKIRPTESTDRDEGFDPAELVERSRFDPEAMFAELRGLVETRVNDEPLRRLVLGLLDRHHDRLRLLPATARHFFPFAGGWLEHTLTVTKTSLWLTERYHEHYPDLHPPLNVDLIVAGAALHDLGRVAELDAGPAPVATVPGRLFGHLFLGRDLIRDAAREQGDVHPELLMLLEHLVIVHLNLPEWGSPRLPLIPEALILHHADDLDAKLEMYARCLSRDTVDGPFTDRDPILNRQLFKGRSI
jgi:3'-5' exoribonuclease